MRDSNPRMAESKSAALPLGESPASQLADYSEKLQKSKLFIWYISINSIIVNNMPSFYSKYLTSYLNSIY